MRLIIEASPHAPIYNRIASAFSDVVKNSRQEIKSINIASYNSMESYIKDINEYNADYCIITNSSSPLSREYTDKAFYFELIQSKLIFIHHDTFTGHFNGEKIKDRITAFLRIRDKSSHFCLELYNYLDMRTLGISNSYPIYHAFEYTHGKNISKYNYVVSFVGHVVPGVSSMHGDILVSRIYRQTSGVELQD